MSLKIVLLTLLNREPQSGYDIVQAFDQAVGFFWNASHQQVYRELGALSEANLVRYKLVKQKDSPDKKIYSINNQGKMALQAWLEEPIKESKIKDLLLVKLLNTNKDNAGLMLKELEIQTQSSQTQRATFREIEKMYYSPKLIKTVPLNEIMVYAALRKGILGIEAYLIWLDEVKTLIHKRFVS